MIVCPQKTNFCSELFMALEKYYMVCFFFKKKGFTFLGSIGDAPEQSFQEEEMLIVA